MAAGDFSFNGWSTSSIIPRAQRIAKVQAGLKPSVDPALASRKVKAVGAEGGAPASAEQLAAAQEAANTGKGTTGETTSNSATGVAEKTGTQTGKLATEFGAVTDGATTTGLGTKTSQGMAGMTPTQKLTDAALGSRAFYTQTPGISEITASGSVYGSPDIPAAISGAVADLNSTSRMQLAAREELMNRILERAQAGDINAWEALRAGVLAPKASAVFGAGITDPNVGKAALTTAGANAGLTAAKTSAVQQAANTSTAELDRLVRQRQAMGEATFGQYAGSQQESLDAKIAALRERASASSAVQQLGRAAATGGNAWVSPYVPMY